MSDLENMLSAFGVDHGDFAKSFVNGKFVRAADLSAKQKKKIKAGGQYRKVKGPTDEDTAFKQNMKRERVVMNQISRNLGSERKVTVNAGDMEAAKTFRIGGKNTGRSVILGSAKTSDRAKTLMAHESAHAKPKRSAYRVHNQIPRDAGKAMREESRADFAASGHYTKLPNDPTKQTTYQTAARAQRGFETSPKGYNEDAMSGGLRVRNDLANQRMIAGLGQQFKAQGNARPGARDIKSYRELQDKLDRQ